MSKGNGTGKRKPDMEPMCQRVLVTKPHNKTPYELLTDNKRGGPREEEQVFLDDLARLQRQEKEANEEVEALRKNLQQETENLVTQVGVAKSSGTNIFSTVSTTAIASGTNLVNTVSIPVSTASPKKGLSLSDTTNSLDYHDHFVVVVVVTVVVVVVIVVVVSRSYPTVPGKMANPIAVTAPRWTRTCFMMATFTWQHRCLDRFDRHLSLLPQHRQALCSASYSAIVGFDCSREDHHTFFSFSA
ncbi:hypothetical protein Tco_0542978 [Tanacetum coccineum]